MYTDLTHIPIIDSHVHVFPEPIRDAIRRWFKKYAWGFKQDGTLEALIRAQFDRGVTGLVFLTYAHRPGIAESLNLFVSRLLQSFPNTIGLGAVHPEDENPLRLVRKAIQEYGLCGVKLHCHVIQKAPNDPLLFPIYEALEEMGGILNIHAGREPSLEGYGADVRLFCGADRTRDVLKRFPNLTVIIPHLGFDESDRFYEMLEQFPNLYLDTTMMLGHFFDIPIHQEKLIRHCDRILYGSDYPHIPYDMEKEVKAILALDLGEEVNRKILFENAANLFPFRFDRSREL